MGKVLITLLFLCFGIMVNDLVSFILQIPTSKQSKYKEQVSEMRKGRNSGLQKEQKEKHMVHLYCYSQQFIGLLKCWITHHLFYISHRHIDRLTVTPESPCWRTSPVTMIWSSSGKPRPVPLKIW